ncbi:MAG: putative porin, partial [Gammaproteobacteria bacterium]|nr:putative porin [Gammaproteobacteria bacterium]
DAVFGLLTDSDFAGGGSDGKGHILKGGYAVRENVNANLTYFITERDANAGRARDYDRLQLDLAFKY